MEETPRGPGVPVYGPMPRANARKLSVWRVVHKQLRTRYAKKRAKADGSFMPLVLSS